MNNFKILGINSDSDTCTICGKTGLKRVVCIETESGEVIYLGCECASKYTGVGKHYTSKTLHTITTDIKMKETVKANLEKIKASIGSASNILILQDISNPSLFTTASVERFDASPYLFKGYRIVTK